MAGRLTQCNARLGSVANVGSVHLPNAESLTSPVVGSIVTFSYIPEFSHSSTRPSKSVSLTVVLKMIAPHDRQSNGLNAGSGSTIVVTDESYAFSSPLMYGA